MPYWRSMDADNLPVLPMFSHTTVAGDFIFVSGMLGTDASLRLSEGGIGPQTAQALRNLEDALKACDATLADVCKVNVYLVDMGRFSEMNQVYVAAMNGSRPARITVGCAALALGALVEIDCVAYKPAR